MAGRIRPTLHGSQLRGGNLTLEEKAALAARYGYPGLDFTLVEAQAYEDPAAVRDLLAQHGLEASTIGGALEARLTDDEAAFAAALERLRGRAETVAALGGTRTGTVLPGRQNEPMDKLWPVVVERIRRVDDALEGTGVRLGIEFIGVKTSRLELPHAFVQSMAEANRLLDDAGGRNVGLTLDSYHWYAGEDSLQTIRNTPAERLVILHVNDAKDLPPAQLDDRARVLPGEGVIPLADWLRAIAATGFDGFIALEVLGPRMAEMDPDAGARVGREVLAPLFAAAGLPFPG